MKLICCYFISDEKIKENKIEMQKFDANNFPNMIPILSLALAKAIELPTCKSVS